jgi:hypothetical protein
MSASRLTPRDVAELVWVPTSCVHEESRAGRSPAGTLGRYRRYPHEASAAEGQG